MHASPRDTTRRAAIVATLLGVLAAVYGPVSPAWGDVDDFEYSSWTSEYDISLDEDGRAVAHVTETLVAEFPEFDQNRGIVRGFPQRYEGAGLGLDILSISDDEGRSVPYETEEDDGVLFLLLGDDSFVHGSTTYVIDYTMRDFMVTGSDSGNDEFYWDLLPFDSSQAIGLFRADISFTGELARVFTGDAACYQGRQGASDRCTLNESEDDDGARVFSVGAAGLLAGEGVTVAIGFPAGTVAQPASRAPDPIADFGSIALAGGALATGVVTVGAVSAFRRRRRTATGIIVAQYDMPDELPPLAAAPMIPGAMSVASAQIVHLAVRGALRIEETISKKGKPRPALRLRDRTRATTPLDRAALDALFPGDETVRTIPASSTSFSRLMQQLVAQGVTHAAEAGWTTKEHNPAARRLRWLALAILLVAIALLAWCIFLDRDLLPLAVVMTVLTFVFALIAFIVGTARHTVLTPAGAQRHEYLMGVKEFIRVAEADRIRMLQSYAGAERRADGELDIVVLYERLLPAAILFGQEKSWSRELEAAYTATGTSPSWTSSSPGIGFAAWMSSFSQTTQAASTYTASSSSSGGSTGGGFAGGGGGGGFSGGR